MEKTLEFLRYFFGKGETEEFKNFTLAHLLPILAGIAVILFIWLFKDKIRALKNEACIRYAISFGLLFSEMSYYWRLVGMPSLGPNPIDHLPITVCGWAVVFCSLLVIGKSQTLFDISYFWLLAGSIFALITPTVITYTGPTRFRYYQFWLEHLLGFIAIFYMIFVHNMRPHIKSMIKAYVSLVVLAIIAYFTNRLLGPGANYLFMARPEDTPSILDILPANFALRVFIMAAVVTFLFLVMYLPWFIMDKKGQKNTEAPKKETVGAV